MNITIIVVLVWFIIGAFSFHGMMSDKDKKSMFKNKISLITFMILAPITILTVTLKSIFKL